MAEAKSPLKWMGGKYLLSRKIIPLFPEHSCYVEPFCGGAWCFFRKAPSRVEVINDINGEIVNFYRVFCANPGFFEHKLRFMLYSRQIFRELYEADVKTLSAEERAWRFFYINHCSFSSRVHNAPTFAVSRTGSNKHQGFLLNFRRNGRLEGALRRLEQAIIECKPYAECIATYDCKETLFYIDPPYWGHESDYGRGIFGREDFRKLAEILGGIEGRFLLSINDTPEIREIFRDFAVKGEFMAHYSANRMRTVKKPELLYGNF